MEISDKLYRILTRQGFEEEFWSDLKTYRAQGSTITRREIYEDLEAIYEAEFNQRQFPSYEAFTKVINRNSRKGQMS